MWRPPCKEWIWRKFQNRQLTLMESRDRSTKVLNIRYVMEQQYEEISTKKFGSYDLTLSRREWERKGREQQCPVSNQTYKKMNYNLRRGTQKEWSRMHGASGTGLQAAQINANTSREQQQHIHKCLWHVSLCFLHLCGKVRGYCFCSWMAKALFIHRVKALKLIKEFSGIHRIILCERVLSDL